MRNLNTAEFDAIVVGAGVNGLVCAALLAQAGRRVALVEAQAHFGGACVTAEVAAGHRVSRYAHLVGPLDAAMMKALRLSRYGLHFTAKRVATVALSPDGRHVVLDGDLRHTAQTLSVHSQTDAKVWPNFNMRMAKMAQSLQRWALAPPGTGVEQGRGGGLFATRPPAKVATALDAGAAARLDGSIADLLDEEFEAPLLKGAIAFDTVLGSAVSPRTEGTAFVAVLKAALEAETPEGIAHPQGGAGAFTTALAKAAEAAGVRTRLNARVASLLFDGDRLAGVALATGEALYAPVVVSSLDPKTTLLGLGAERRLPLGLKRQLKGFRLDGCVAKLNLVLAKPPVFKGLDKRYLKERLVICPSVEHLERSFAVYEQGGFSSDLALEITIPSTHDTSLAPSGQHVLSAHVLYVPKMLAGAAWSDKGKKDLVAAVGATLRQYAPDLPEQILAADLLTPADVERFAGSAGGHWHGGDLTLDQLGPLRPAWGLSRHETPITGLYLCGAGTHPCGGVTGINGRNAAEVVLAHATVRP